MPPVLPVHLLPRLRREIGRVADVVQEPVVFPSAVESLELHLVAADLVHQVGQQGQRQPSVSGQVGAVIADNPDQDAQIPLADRHRRSHQITPARRYPGYGGPGIRRTSDSERRIS